MGNNRIEAIVFDFDGVIVESNAIKTQAFAETFSEYPAELQKEIVQYHKENEGISRVEKIRYFYQNLLQEKLTEEKLSQLSQKFSKLVKEKVITCAYVEGALDFLEKYSSQYPFFLASGTPEIELLEIVEKRGLTPHFQGVFGSPTSKEEIIESVLQKHELDRESTYMVGDSLTDYRAAINTGLKFVGRTHEKNIFPTGTPTFPSPYRALADNLA